MFSSIRTRLTLSHLAVIIAAMGLSGALLLSLLENYFLQAMEDSLATQAQITAQALIPGSLVETEIDAPASAWNTLQQRQSNIALQAQNVAPVEGGQPVGALDLGYLADASLQLSSQLTTRIRLLDTSGIVLVDSHDEDQGADLGTEPLVGQALAGQQATRTEQSGLESAMHMAVPVLVEDRIVGVALLSQPLDDVTDVLSDLRNRWLLSTVVALLLAGVAGLLLSGAISRPVRRLTEATSAVARGYLDQQVPVRSRDELGKLSQTFNEMTARLRAARQMQVDFVANVSHELRTPLTAVKGTVETLRAGAVDDPKVRDRFLETVEEETDRLIRLVQDLLVLSRADSDALNLLLAPVDVGELARETTGQLSAQAAGIDVQLQVQVQPSTPKALADGDRIQQVLMNLLDNAIKYSRPGGTVSVHVDSPGAQGVRVRVEDQGIGIPAEELPRIGERFYRADRARSRTEGGSGLGLAIATALVEAHGGQLSLDSVEGEGTSATFWLPVA
jgi:signal transduction histidine kinase